MKRFFICLLLIWCVGTASHSDAAKIASVDVLYMDHGPMQPTIIKLKELFSKYEGKIKVAWYDFDSQAGEKFMARKGIKAHIPLMIWIDGKNDPMISGKPVAFSGFPTGSGPASFQGKWDLKLLTQALEQATRRP